MYSIEQTKGRAMLYYWAGKKSMKTIAHYSIQLIEVVSATSTAKEDELK